MYPPTTSTMRIDRIEPSRRRKDRGLVFLEGGDLLRVTEQELLVFGLRPGLELPEQLLAQVEQSAKRSEMKARGARLTGSRMLSKKQVTQQRRVEEEGFRIVNSCPWRRVEDGIQGGSPG